MIGFDAGTYNLVCAKRDETNNFRYNKEINAFVKIKLQDRFFFNAMKDKKIPIIERTDENVAYILGEAAVKLAYTMPEIELKRPMQEGCLNPKEKDASEIMNVMVHSLLENVTKDREIVYYSVPANAINKETDADFHSKILKSIFDAYKSETGYQVTANPINEGLALIYAELGDKNYTGCSASLGGGMVNVCFAMFGIPLFQFALVNSGDWIDKMAAKACGENETFINQEKTKIDLAATPTSAVERAIQTQYKIMIEKTTSGISKGLAESGKKIRASDEIDFVVAGGTSMPQGFIELFKESVMQAKLPIKIGNIIRPADPLLSVARGCLFAAENSVS